MEESLKFLSKVFDLLVEGDVFVTKPNELKSIVDFKHPEELKVRINSGNVNHLILCYQARAS